MNNKDEIIESIFDQAFEYGANTPQEFAQHWGNVVKGVDPSDIKVLKSGTLARSFDEAWERVRIAGYLNHGEGTQTIFDDFTDEGYRRSIWFVDWDSLARLIAEQRATGTAISQKDVLDFVARQ